jgi:hypothetical protein
LEIVPRHQAASITDESQIAKVVRVVIAVAYELW